MVVASADINISLKRLTYRRAHRSTSVASSSTPLDAASFQPTCCDIMLLTPSTAL